MQRFKTVLLALVVGCGSSSAGPDGSLATDGSNADASMDAPANTGDGAAAETAMDQTPGVDAAPLDAAATDGPNVSPDASNAEVGEQGPRYDAEVSFPEATLVTIPTTHAFALTPIGDKSEPFKFVITNIGLEATGPITHSIEGSTEFAITGSTCSLPLASLGTCEVTVTFLPISAGDKSGRLTVSAAPGKTFSALLSGTSRAPAALGIDPTMFFFPPTVVPSGVSEPATFTVTNKGGSALGPLTVSIDGAEAADFGISEADCGSATLQPAASCHVRVLFTPKTAGAKSATLTVAAGAAAVVHASLSGSGVEPPKVTLTPTAQSFGTVAVGMKSAFTFAAFNEGGATTGKLTATLEGINVGEFSIKSDCDPPLQPADTCSITVTFAPTTAGSKTASLRVTASPGGTVKADLYGTGAASSGGLSLTSPSPDPFGTVKVGESSTGLFIVENKGSVATGAIMPSISSSTSAEFVITDNACPAHLDPAQQCAITVRFSPLFTGLRSATLQVLAQPGGFATLPLSGAAVSASLRITPVTRNFSDRVIGSTTNIQTQSFIVSNLGPVTTGALAVTIESADPSHASSFELFGINECAGIALAQNRTCRVDVRFLPKQRGALIANLVVQGQPGGVIRASMTGRGCEGSVANSNCN